MASSIREDSLKNIVTALQDKETVPSALTGDKEKALSAPSPDAIMDAIENDDEEALADFVKNKGVLKATLAKLDQKQLQAHVQNLLQEKRRNGFTWLIADDPGKPCPAKETPNQKAKPLAFKTPPPRGITPRRKNHSHSSPDNTFQ